VSTSKLCLPLSVVLRRDCAANVFRRANVLAPRILAAVPLTVIQQLPDCCNRLPLHGDKEHSSPAVCMYVVLSIGAIATSMTARFSSLLFSSRVSQRDTNTINKQSGEAAGSSTYLLIFPHGLRSVWAKASMHSHSPRQTRCAKQSCPIAAEPLRGTR
jgi:hypothetical protein